MHDLDSRTKERKVSNTALDDFSFGGRVAKIKIDGRNKRLANLDIVNLGGVEGEVWSTDFRFYVNIKAMEEKDKVPQSGLSKEGNEGPRSNLEVEVTGPVCCLAV